MASSSVSQEDLDNDFELASRRSRIRSARTRNLNPSGRAGDIDAEDSVGCDGKTNEMLSGIANQDHDSSPKPSCRLKDKRGNSILGSGRIANSSRTIAISCRANHINKGKAQRDRRKLREKRRSTGVVHLPSTESTGEDENLLSMNPETRKNTQQNEVIDRKEDEESTSKLMITRAKSPSDLEADDEDNQDCDSLHQSDSTISLVQPTCLLPDTSRPKSPVHGYSDTSDLLEKVQEENRRLLLLVEEKEKHICNLEQQVAALQWELATHNTDRQKLKEENNSLIRAMASLSSK